ncbi:hypothetical protein RIF29_38828 [Crotalaria pallida]|uniref:Uncharacterized protein n=1 Tax=Crotalaria pallida TaxID=3830 RepID=A0AAN9E0X8_CROPI
MHVKYIIFHVCTSLVQSLFEILSGSVQSPCKKFWFILVVVSLLHMIYSNVLNLKQISNLHIITFICFSIIL